VPNVTIRAAVADDVADLTRVVTAAYAPYVAAGLQLPPVADGLAQDIGDHYTIVAVADGRIVGGLVLMAGDPPRIANLAVSPDAAGQGLAANF
jgi:N-acetylglutamate synthase-like GNAT family acetyltransferase